MVSLQGLVKRSFLSGAKYNVIYSDLSQLRIIVGSVTKVVKTFGYRQGSRNS